MLEALTHTLAAGWLIAAAPPPPLALSFEAGLRCPTGEQLLDHLTRTLGEGRVREGQRQNGEFGLNVEPLSQGPGLRLRLLAPDGTEAVRDAPAGKRACEQLAETAALLALSWVGPRLWSPAAAPLVPDGAFEEELPAPPPSNVVAQIAPLPPPTPVPWRFVLRASPDWQPTTATFGGSLAFDWSFWRFLGIGGSYRIATDLNLPDPADPRNLSVVIRRSASVAGWASVFLRNGADGGFRFLAGIEGQYLDAEGSKGYVPPNRDRTFVPFLVLGAQAEGRISGPLIWFLSIQVDPQLGNTQFGALPPGGSSRTPTQVASLPPVELLLSVGIGYAFF